LGFGFIFAQSQATAGMLLCSSLAKTPKFLAAEWPQYFFKRYYLRPLAGLSIALAAQAKNVMSKS